MSRRKTSPDEAGDATTVRIDQDMTIYTAAAMKERLLTSLKNGSGVTLDLSGVPEIDTAGIQLLLLTAREAERTGGRMTIDAMSPMVGETLRFLNLGAALGIAGSAESTTEVRP
ncbi:MAG: STAS domain-containing protein [Burkholderiales bacterium]|nr:STAS domain-containing protein [Burkholderiales bacterium]